MSVNLGPPLVSWNSFDLVCGKVTGSKLKAFIIMPMLNVKGFPFIQRMTFIFARSYGGSVVISKFGISAAYF